ncbi:hypothetical protein GGI11_002356 [Coemansia sp. RSA 2049]|nr:hypothetical protein GGI11_002356 [Coemansia sp. RSA 2049]
MVAEASNLPESLIDLVHLTADYKSMLELVRKRDAVSAQVEGNESAKIMRESDMYPCIKALVRFTADAVEEAYRMPLQMPGRFKPLRRRIIAFDETDRTPGDADDSHRIDIGLKAENNILQEQSDEANRKNSIKILYSNMLAVVELGHQNQAYAQLLKYSRNMYARQNSCRFVWGLTVCNSDFRICLLCNDRLISSASIDVVKEAGRRLLVTWLVNMSLCDEDKLGRDPTTYQNSKTGEWKIMVFDDGSEDLYKLFTIIDCMRTADRTFGRHTRCYRCIETDLSDDAERDSNNSAEQHNKREIFIKDTWAIVFRESDQKLRDEVSLLREINNKLKDNAELADKYPALVAGGAVKQVGKDGKYFEDSIDNVFSELGEDTMKQLTFRIHKRMAMSPIGEDIRSVKSVNELIIAAADIMEVHSAIRKSAAFFIETYLSTTCLSIAEPQKARKQCMK